MSPDISVATLSHGLEMTSMPSSAGIIEKRLQRCNVKKMFCTEICGRINIVPDLRTQTQIDIVVGRVILRKNRDKDT